MQLSTPSYRLKKEKRDLRNPVTPTKQYSSSSSLIDPSSVMVVGAVDDQGILQSPGSSSGKKKKTNPAEKVKASSSKDKAATAEKPSKSLSSKTHRSSPNTRIEELDQKWSVRFNRLEALLLAKSLDRQERTFTSVKVAPHTHLLLSRQSPLSHSSDLKLQVRRLLTSPLRDKLPTSHMNRTLLNMFQICLLVIRLLPSRRANRPRGRCRPTDVQI